MKTSMKRWIAICLVGFGFSALGYACSSADELIDCSQLCSNYETCEQDNFDRSECTSLCESKADVDDAYAAAVDTCEECIDDKSCSEQAADCTAECAGVTYEDEDDSNSGNLAEAEACLSVCNNHEECDADTYDRSQCTRNCENEADADPTGFAQTVLDCDTCIEDKACAEQDCAVCDSIDFATLGAD